MKIALLALLALVPVAHAADESRVRLTETSITEVGRIEGSRDRLKTKGYGFGYIHACGFGLHLTGLSTKNASANLEHNTFDLSYTKGFLDDHILITTGFGIGLSGSAETTDATGAKRTTKDFQDRVWFLGPGFSIGWFEAYWIHRRNYLSYGAGTVKMESKHYQLGLGARFSL